MSSAIKTIGLIPVKGITQIVTMEVPHDDDGKPIYPPAVASAGHKYALKSINQHGSAIYSQECPERVIREISTPKNESNEALHDVISKQEAIILDMQNLIEQQSHQIRQLGALLQRKEPNEG